MAQNIIGRLMNNEMENIYKINYESELFIVTNVIETMLPHVIQSLGKYIQWYQHWN